MQRRCPWCGDDPQYVAYHDQEWGVPVRDDVALFVKLTLDTFQSGLSWLVVLRKSDAILDAMDELDPVRLAGWKPERVDMVVKDARIIRNRAKIEAAVNNARCFVQIAERGQSFSELLWSYVGGKTIRNAWISVDKLPTRSSESEAMARELKTLGFKWTGPTVCYAFMQAVGMVNDHLTDCFRYEPCNSL